MQRPDRWIVAVVAVCVCLAVALLASRKADTTTSVFPKNEREYTLLVDHLGGRLLTVNCEYLGKQPHDSLAFQEVSSHNWSQQDTDFYRLSITNSSDHPVSIRSVSHRMKTGSYRGRKVFSARQIQQTWGDSQISPGATISRSTHFVWAAADSNALIKTYVCDSVSKSGGRFEFIVELPLHYSRR